MPFLPPSDLPLPPLTASGHQRMLPPHCYEYSSRNHDHARRPNPAGPSHHDECPNDLRQFCRGTLTPEEIVLDLGFNANAFGVKVLEEDIELRNRIILSPATAKRLLLQLNEMVRRHEQNFGEVEIDFRRSLKANPNGASPQA